MNNLLINSAGLCTIIHRANPEGRPLELPEWHTLLKMACVYFGQEAESRTIDALVFTPQRNLDIEMPPHQERRASKRAPCRLVCPFEVMKFGDKRTVNLTKGIGHAINTSVRGILLLLPVTLNNGQVVEIQVSPKARTRPRTTLVEVCWTRPISVGARVTMYLAGTRRFFALPVPS